MNDFEGLLAPDLGFKPLGKAAPMAAAKANSDLNPTRASNIFTGSFSDGRDSGFPSTGSQRNQDFGGLDDLLGGSARFPNKSESHRGDSEFNFDSMFRGSSNSGAQSSNSPVYDRPVYDDDIFDGVPGLKSSSKVKYGDFFSASSQVKGNAEFDDLLGGFGKSEPSFKSTNETGVKKNEKGGSDFDDLIPGFGGTSTPRARSTTEARWSSEPTAAKRTSKLVENPFDVSGKYTDPLEEISKLTSSRSTKMDSSTAANGTGRVFDDINTFAGLGKSVPAFSSEGDNRDKVRSPSRTGISSSDCRTSTSKETTENQPVRSPEHYWQKNASAKNDQQSDPILFDLPAASTNSHKSSVPQSASPPSYETTLKSANMQVDMSPRFEDNLESSEDIWLTVSEVPLFTQPTSAPPPSRPPPPRPVQISRAESGSYTSTNSRKKVNDYSSSPKMTQYFHVPESAPDAVRESVVAPVDEFEDFAMGRGRSNVDARSDGFTSEELEMNSAAAAMKEAMDRAEAKFRHAKEVRGRESSKTGRSKEAVHLDKDENIMQDEKSEKVEQLQREKEEEEQRRLQKEREKAREIEREQRRLQKERERARELEEREKARQAVERATREARERAAAEARLKAERAAVQRAQAEARERAAADARVRAEKVAAEARERASAESKEREAQERAAIARAEAEARAKAERAAVQRAAQEARERAAAGARERAAAAARVNQQKSENDLENFFMAGRATSAPRPRANANSVDPFFDTQPQNRQEPEAAKKPSTTSSSMRKASSTTNIVDDLSSIFGAPPSSGEFQEVEGESEERRRARLERHQRTQERAAKALAEKNQRDLQIQRDQAERHRIAETLDAEIKRWAAGKEGNLRALLSTLQYVLWPECGWQPVSLTDLITGAAVKKAYRKATLCIHPDKVQQKGANLQQKYIAEKVFDILKEAWNKFNSEELF